MHIEQISINSFTDKIFRVEIGKNMLLWVALLFNFEPLTVNGSVSQCVTYMTLSTYDMADDVVDDVGVSLSFALSSSLSVLIFFCPELFVTRNKYVRQTCNIF